MQGGSPQVLLEAPISSPQQTSAPPGRLAHPSPPQAPHEAAQHLSPVCVCVCVCARARLSECADMWSVVPVPERPP